jgi:hypothetical protein
MTFEGENIFFDDGQKKGPDGKVGERKNGR